MANDDKAVHNLISSLRDAEKGFAELSGHLKNPEYKAYFLEESRVRGGYAQELERAVNRTTSADVHETGTAAGALHRAWAHTKAAAGGGDHSILETAEQGEDSAKKAYSEALADTSVSDTIRVLIAQQAEHINHSHDTVKAYRDTEKVHA